MKKVLSLVLALAMVIGMSTVAFAAGTYSGTTNAGIFVQDETKEYDITMKLPTAITAFNDVSDAIAAAALDNTLISYSSGSAADVDDILTFLGEGKRFTLGTTSVGYKVTPTKDPNTDRWLPTGNYSLIITVLDAAAPATTIRYTHTIKFEVQAPKGTAATDTVPSTYKVTGIADNWTDFVDWSSAGDLSNKFLVVTEDSTFSFPLVAGMFYWEDQDGNDIVYATNSAYNPKTKVRTTHLKNVTLRKTNLTNNSGTVKSLEIDGTDVKLKTVTYFLKCGNTDVSLDLDLAYKSSASGDKLYISFNIANDEVLVDSGQGDVDTTGHVYIKADESVRNLELQIGEGLSLFKGLGSGQKCYARVSLELSAGDEKLFQQYSELSDVYTLYTVGVQSANVYAEFTDLDDTYFVYDENFKLLGTTADSKLPFSNKYYLTTKKVDLAGTASSEEPTDESSESTPTDIGNVPSGGGSTAVSNYNPNTGA